ncbi:MAG: hypothetical protein AB2689_06040 [Candidatus Thiodiazotropha taylori]
MKPDNQLVLCLLVFFFGVLSGHLILAGYLDIQPEDSLPALTTLLAAFLGAWAAYRLQDRKEIRKEFDRQVAFGNDAIAALIDNMHQLQFYQSINIDPFRHDKHRWIKILPPEFDFEPNFKLNIANLNFFWSAGNSKIVFELSKELFSLRLLLNNINKRSEIYSKSVLPKLESIGFVGSGEVTTTQLDEVLGKAIVHELKRITDDIVEHLDITISNHLRIANELFHELKKLHPGKKILHVSLKG